MDDKYDLGEIYHRELPPVLAELAATPPMLRLKQVGMNCGCEYTAFPRFANGSSYSRWMHSLGVGRIVWHFTGSPAQAAAGLLHDLATPPFAHVVDFLRGDYLTQEATEAGTRERIAESPELRTVLARHGLCCEEVSDYHRYPIADNDSPRLSADRLEYSLGNALRWGFLSREQIAAIYADLRVGTNEDGAPELVFGSLEQAAAFGRAALSCAEVYVSDADRCAMQTLCELLARALESGVLSAADLEGTEPALIARLEASPLSGDWLRFRALSRTLRAMTPPDQRPWRQIPAKKRRIDPLVAQRGRLSALDSAFRDAMCSFLAEDQREWLLAEPEQNEGRY